MRRTVGSVMSITLAGKCLNFGSHYEISIGRSREKKKKIQMNKVKRVQWIAVMSVHMYIMQNWLLAV